MLLFFVHLRSQQKRTEIHLQLLNLQCCHFDIVILRVAIISNVQNVRLQRRHRPTDDSSTRRWRGSQQTGSDVPPDPGVDDTVLELESVAVGDVPPDP